MSADKIKLLKRDRTLLRQSLRRLMFTVQEYSEAHFFDDEEEMQRVAAKVNKAMRNADTVLSATTSKIARTTT